MDFLSNLQNYFNPSPKNTMKKEEKLIIETSFKLIPFDISITDKLSRVLQESILLLVFRNY